MSFCHVPCLCRAHNHKKTTVSGKQIGAAYLTRLFAFLESGSPRRVMVSTAKASASLTQSRRT